MKSIGLCLNMVLCVLAVRTQFARADVGANGSFSTSIPIEVPRYYGLTPTIAITYDSASRAIDLGRGWALSAGSAIERRGPFGSEPAYDSNDQFFLDGRELTPCTGQSSKSASCLSGGTHSTKTETYQRIRSSKVSRPIWEIWSKDGTRSLYEQQDGATNSTGLPYRWLLSTVQDTHGNKVHYSYSCPNDCYLDSVTYGEGIACSSPPMRPPDMPPYKLGSVTVGAEVVFLWTTEFGNASSFDFSDGATHYKTRDRVLKAIDVRFGGFRQRLYSFSYAATLNDGAVTLQSATQYGSDAVLDARLNVTSGTALPARKYASASMVAPTGRYESDSQALGAGGLSVAGPSVPYVESAPSDSNEAADPGDELDHNTFSHWFIADLNGDGLSDSVNPTIAYPGILQIRARLREQGSTGPQLRTGIITTNTAIPIRSGHAPRIYRFIVMDTNGDKKSDLVVIVNGSQASAVAIFTATSRGDGTFTVSAGFQSSFPAWEERGESFRGQRTQWTSGDVDGDGRADIVSIGFADEVCTPLNMGWCRCDPSADQAKQLNMCWKAELRTGVSDGNGGYRSSSTATNYAFRHPEDRSWFVHDVNGDGLADISNVYSEWDSVDRRYELGVHTALGRGDGTFRLLPDHRYDVPFEQLDLRGYDGVPTPYGSGTVLSGDFNGDHRPDFALVQLMGKAPAPDAGTIPWSSINLGLTYVQSADGAGSYIVGPPVDTGLAPSFHNTYFALQAGGPTGVPNTWMTADFNGDGRDDIVAVGQVGNGILAIAEFLSRPQSTFDPSAPFLRSPLRLKSDWWLDCGASDWGYCLEPFFWTSWTSCG
jgi:hypothetical protein